MPEATELKSYELVIPREELPRRLQVTTALAIHAIVIPVLKEAWVIIPRLDHTFYVGKKEELKEAIISEVKRMASARELTPAAYLSMLPSREEKLVFIDVALERIDRAPEGRVANLEKEILERRKKKLAVDVLESIGQPLHDRLDAK